MGYQWLDQYRQPSPGAPGAGSPQGPLPTSLAQFQRNFYAQPNVMGDINQHPQGPLSLQYQAYLADQEYRKASEQQLASVLQELRGGRRTQRQLLRGAGDTALKEAERSSKERVAAGEQSLISRGLYNTTALDAHRRGEGEALDRTRGAIREDVATRRAEMDARYNLPIAQTIGSVNQEAPSYGLLADLLRAKMTPANTQGQYAPLLGVAGGAIGAGIGGYFGGPAGATAGYGIGSGVGGGLGSYIR